MQQDLTIFYIASVFLFCHLSLAHSAPALPSAHPPLPFDTLVTGMPGNGQEQKFPLTPGGSSNRSVQSI